MRKSIKAYNWLAFEINRKSLERHISKIKGRVADLGCGESTYKDKILSVADEYIGVDWDNSYHDLTNINIYADFARPLPFRNASINTIVSFQVLEHLAEPSLFIEECNRVLKPDGIVFLTVPFMWHVHEEPYDYFRYTRYGLGYLFKKHGFIEINIEENTGFWQMWILKFNYHTNLFSNIPLKLLLFPFWSFGQIISPILDKLFPHPQETGSYTLIAKKP